jgi:thermitase
VRFEPGTTASERLGARAAADVQLDGAVGIPRTQLVTTDGPVADAVTRLERQPGVAHAQPNYILRASAPAPADTLFPHLWGLDNTGQTVDGVAGTAGFDVAALDGWDTTRGAGQVIAIVDTGIDLTHPDLDGSLWTNPGEAPNGVDDDGNGRIDDVRGFDFVHDDGDPNDYEFHGTHVAGTAAAEADNLLGIAGVAPGAEVMAVRALDGDGSGTTADVAAGIVYAAQEGADVINLSLGSIAPPNPTLSQAVDVAAAHDALVVAAAGNEANDNDVTPTMPCSLPQANLICVAAATQDGLLAGFSSFGATSVDLAGPGTKVLSAETDYSDPPVYTEGFEAAGTPPGWVNATVSGVQWATTASAASVGTRSVTDSPAGDYAPDSDTQLILFPGLNLTGQRGCRMHFDLDTEIEPPALGGFFDLVLVGATAPGGAQDAQPFAGDSGGFEATEVSISDVDNRAGVSLVMALFSDDLVEMDGAYVDNLRLLCRTASYQDGLAGNYVFFNGTSMATPHVAGVAALVRAADPGAPAAQVADALRASAAPLPHPGGMTVTDGMANAPAAIQAALAIPNPQPPGGGGGGGGPTPPPPAPKPKRPGPAALRDVIAVDRRGRVAIAIRGEAGLRGKLTVTARVRRKKLVLIRKSFRTNARGRAVVRVRLRGKRLRLIRRQRRVRANATVVLRNSAGLASTTTVRGMVVRLKRR